MRTSSILARITGSTTALWICAVLWVLPTRSYGDPPAHQTITSNFMLTPLRIQGGRAVTSPPRPRSELVSGRWFTVAIIASWCPHSQELMHHVAGKAPKVKPDLLVFLDDEIDRLAKKLVDQGADRDKVKAAVAQSHAAHDVLFAPEQIVPRLPYYVVSHKLFDFVTEYPTFLVCDDSQCELAE